MHLRMTATNLAIDVCLRVQMCQGVLDAQVQLYQHSQALLSGDTASKAQGMLRWT